jgi:hypothetical protein
MKASKLLTLFVAVLSGVTLQAADKYPFKDGYPTAEAAKNAIDDADYQSAMTGLPILVPHSVGRRHFQWQPLYRDQRQ